MLRIVVPAIQRSSDRLDDDRPDDGNEQDELKEGVGDRRGVQPVDALSTGRTNEQLAETPHTTFLRQKPECLVVRRVITHKIGLDSLAFVPGIVGIFSRCSLVVDGRQQFPK